MSTGADKGHDQLYSTVFKMIHLKIELVERMSYLL